MKLYTATNKEIEVEFAAIAFTGDLWLGRFENAVAAAKIFDDEAETKVLRVVTDEQKEPQIYKGFTRLKSITKDESDGRYNIGLGRQYAEE